MKCLKKYLLLFLLFCICMSCTFLLKSNCYANTVLPDDNCKYYFIFSYQNNTFLITTNYEDPCVGGAGDITNGYVFYFDYSLIFHPYILKDGSYISCDLSEYVSEVNNGKSFTVSPIDDFKMLNSNFNLKLDGYWSSQLNKTYFYEINPISNDPYIVNDLDSLATWKFDNLWIDYGDYDINKTIYLHICKKTVNVSGSSSFYYTDSVIALSTDGKYYESYENGQVYYFSIPKDNLPFTVSSGDKIIFYLSSSASNLGGAYSSDEPLKDSSIFDTKSFTVGSSYTDEDKQKDYQDKISSSLEDQKQAIEENTKTNKNIFEKIGDILSYINPFSENFFGKKLVELILDGLKSLFVPEDGFFDTYFTDLKNWFSDRLGFLWTPFDIIIEILNKILNINFSEPIFHIPEINEPFSGSKLISEYDYNLNSLLDNDIFKNIHDIYFIGVDAVIIFALINLARRKIEEVFSN